jgi:hypothetical protein
MLRPIAFVIRTLFRAFWYGPAPSSVHRHRKPVRYLAPAPTPKPEPPTDGDYTHWVPTFPITHSARTGS